MLPTECNKSLAAREILAEERKAIKKLFEENGMRRCKICDKPIKGKRNKSGVCSKCQLHKPSKYRKIMRDKEMTDKENKYGKN